MLKTARGQRPLGGVSNGPDRDLSRAAARLPAECCAFDGRTGSLRKWARPGSNRESSLCESDVLTIPLRAQRENLLASG